MMEFGDTGFHGEFNEGELDSFLDHCTDSWTCPLCAENGVIARIRLYQANDNQAIYFCETKDCVYPQTDDSDPVVVNRSILELPVDGPTLEKFGLPPSLLDEGGLTFKDLYELCLIHDAYKEFDDWARLEKELAKVKDTMARHSTSSVEKIEFNLKCTPLNYLRQTPSDLIKFVRHFIPNIDDVLELLNMDIL